MSLCEKCIHREVCGVEGNHEEAMTFCADMIPEDAIINTINRQAVLDAIHEADMNAYDERSLLRDLTQAVNELPSADMKWRWCK